MNGIISFLDMIGIFDVILPFLFIMGFFITLAVFNGLKNKKVLAVVLGVLSFPVAFIVVALTKVIAVINQTLSMMAVLLIFLGISTFLTVLTVKEKKLKPYPYYLTITIISWVLTIIVLLNISGYWAYVIYFLFS